jgi:hypothetical protein
MTPDRQEGSHVDLGQTLRRCYIALIEALIRNGKREEALECANLAVRQGLWAHPAQRPVHFVHGLPALPRHDRRRYWIARYLEQHYRDILAELDQVRDPTTSGFMPVEERLVGTGRWDQVVFYEDGQRFDRAARLFPVTAAVLDRIPAELRAGGVIMLSWLQPGTHIVAHCGFTNARLRVHLGLKTSEQARMRVDQEILTWKPGECLVFDDSFEHEVWHMGDTPRVVLLFDTLHPALPEHEKAALLAFSRPDWQARADEFMKDRGIARIERGDDDRIGLQLDDATSLLLRRYLQEGDIASIARGRDGALQVAFRS